MPAVSIVGSLTLVMVTKEKIVLESGKKGADRGEAASSEAQLDLGHGHDGDCHGLGLGVQREVDGALYDVADLFGGIEPLSRGSQISPGSKSTTVFPTSISKQLG